MGCLIRGKPAKAEPRHPHYSLISKIGGTGTRAIFCRSNVSVVTYVTQASISGRFPLSNVFWPMSRDVNLYWVCHLTRQFFFFFFLFFRFFSPKTVLQGTLEGGRRHSRQRKCWMDRSKSGHPCPCRNYSRWPPAEQTGRGPLLNRTLSVPHT